MFAKIGSRTRKHTLGAIAAACVSFGWLHSAHADDSSGYCAKVMARAQSDAARLFAPTIRGQVIRFPVGTPADTSGLQVGRSLQPRAAVSVGVIDIYKGFRVLDVAEAECLRQASAAELSYLFSRREDLGRQLALEKKIAYLETQSGRVAALVKAAEDRFAAHTSTVSELQQVRAAALVVNQSLAAAQADLASVKARGAASASEPIESLVRTHEHRSLELERRVSRLRGLDAWGIGLSGGVAATPTAEVFGVAEVSYNFGGLFSSRADRRAEAARAEELQHARYEMRQQFKTVVEELRANAEHSRSQAKLIQDELERIATLRASLEATDAPNRPAAEATLALRAIELESERTFFLALSEAQRALGASS